MIDRIGIKLLALILFSGCSVPSSSKEQPTQRSETKSIQEAFRSPEFGEANIDSLAYWSGDRELLLVTAKGTHELLVLNF